MGGVHGKKAGRRHVGGAASAQRRCRGNAPGPEDCGWSVEGPEACGGAERAAEACGRVASCREACGREACGREVFGAEGCGQKGLSALELLTTLAVAAVLVGLSVPGFAAFRRSAGISSAANELIWALHLARSSAVLRGQPVTVCLTVDEGTCLQTPGTSAAGWLVVQTVGQAVAVQGTPADPVLHRFRLPDTVAIQGTRPAVTFWPVSRAGSTSTFDICDVERRTPGRSIVVSQTGRPRVAAEVPSCAG
jgi:type IV fimbrial biogenesis protein FimT